MCQARGDRLQQQVADGVAERIIDGLEVIEVEEHQGRAAAGSIGQRDGQFQAFHGQAAIRQAGERVVKGHELDAFFGALAIADVDKADDVVARLVRRVADHRHMQPCRIGFAVLAPVLDLSLPVLGVLQVLADPGQKSAIVALGVQHLKRTADHLVGAVARHFGKGTVDRDNAHAGVGDDNALATALEHLGR